MQNPNWDNINYLPLFVKHMQHFECTVKFVD